MRIARALFYNFGAKVLAVVVAVLIWFNASGQEEVVRVRAADLVLVGLGDSLAIAGRVPSTAELRVTASRRRVATLGFRNIDVAVDLSGLGPGRHRLPLSGEHLRGAGTLRDGSIQILSPSVLEVELEPLGSRRAQVSLDLRGKLPAGVVMLSSAPLVEPAWVTLHGPVSELERIQHVSTEPVDLSRVRTTGAREVALVSGTPSITCEPAKVNVTLEVGTLGERVLANVPPTVLLDTPDVDAEVQPSTVSLTLEGPSAVLDTLSSGDVSVLVEISGGQRAAYRLAPTVILPRGITLTRISADTLDVRVFRATP